MAEWRRSHRIWRWKIVIWRRQSGAGGLSDFVWVNKVSSLKTILLDKKLKNTCQPFHGECQVLVTSKMNIFVIQLLYICERTLNNKKRSKFSQKRQETIEIIFTGVVSFLEKSCQMEKACFIFKWFLAPSPHPCINSTEI